MGLTLAKCPACGAELNLETDRDYFYCPHCGSKVMQVDDRIVIEHVNRTINEAEVRKQEFEREKYFHEEQKQAEGGRDDKVHLFIRIRVGKRSVIGRDHVMDAGDISYRLIKPESQLSHTFTSSVEYTQKSR